MSVMLLAVAFGCVAGVATGGRVSNLAKLRLRLWPVLIAGVAAQMVLGYVPGAARWVLVSADCAAMVGWAWLNRPSTRRLSGPDLIGIGVALNAIVIAVNGGMPVSRFALGHAGLSPTMNVGQGHFYKHIIMTSHTHLSWLGDLMPLSIFREVISPGDLVMLIGISLTVWAATRFTAEAKDVRLARLATRS